MAWIQRRWPSLMVAFFGSCCLARRERFYNRWRSHLAWINSVIKAGQTHVTRYLLKKKDIEFCHVRFTTESPKFLQTLLNLPLSCSADFSWLYSSTWAVFQLFVSELLIKAWRLPGWPDWENFQYWGEFWTAGNLFQNLEYFFIEYVGRWCIKFDKRRVGRYFGQLQELLGDFSQLFTSTSGHPVEYTSVI
jgi:hypothetical protein